MSQYEGFAEVYAEGDYTEHSQRMAAILPELLKEYGYSPDSILDMACGEGSFARMMADRGYDVEGFDLSNRMVKIAKEKSNLSKVSFEVEDMRSFSKSGFDLVTCWYDSLNYLKNVSELEEVFENVREALDGQGYFIFDMNTYHGLSKAWPAKECYVAEDSPQLFEVHRPDFDEESEIFTLRITGFRKTSGEWNKFEERHEERAYSLNEVKEALRNARFNILDIFGDLENRKDLEEEDSRMWFVAKVEE